MLTPDRYFAACKKAANGGAAGFNRIPRKAWLQIMQNADCLRAATRTASVHVVLSGKVDDDMLHMVYTAGLLMVIDKEERAVPTSTPANPPGASDQTATPEPRQASRAALGTNESSPWSSSAFEFAGESKDGVEVSVDSPGPSTDGQKKARNLRMITLTDIFIILGDVCGLDSADMEKLRKYLKPIQLGIGTRAGVEVAFHQLQTLLELHGADPDIMTIFFDIKNAYMTANRGLMLDALYKQESLCTIWDLAYWHLSRPAARFLRMSNDEIRVTFQTEGGPQGGVLMPVLFSVMYQELLVLAMKSAPAPGSARPDGSVSKGVLPTAILDDFAICGHVADL